MQDTPERLVEVRVHERDDPRIERILALIDEAARPRPLVEVLGVLCSEVAAIVEAQVGSLYVRDDAPDDDVLVMRANVGFPGGAVGQVRLTVGEGITGFAAECMRPVTVSTATDDEHYKAVPGLGEEEFPIFLALPILVGRRAEAVLVLQRRIGRPFDEGEVVLATALATSFAYALERARTRRAEVEDETPRSAQLNGRGLSPGRALGRVETFPTFEGLAALARARGLTEPSEPTARAARVVAALEQVAREHSRTVGLVQARLSDPVRDHLSSLFLLWADRRFQEVVQEAATLEPNPALAMRDVARVYARAPHSVGLADESSMERSTEAEALCLNVAARAVDERTPSQGSAVLVAGHLPVLVVLTAIAHRAACVAVGAPLAEDALAAEVARAGDMPLIVNVGGLFAWTRAGDRLLVDADAGVVEVNPGAVRVAQFRSGA